MPFKYVFGGIPVADLDPALDWYERLLGRPPDMRPHEGEAAWGITDTGWIYVVADPERAGNGLVAILVDDLRELVAALAERGITTGDIETLRSGALTTVISDPEGNRITLGEAPG